MGSTSVFERAQQIAPAVLSEREQEILRLGWQWGFSYRDRLTAEAAAELRAIPIVPVPTRTEAVARRRAELDAYAAAAYARDGRREWLGLERGWAS